MHNSDSHTHLELIKQRRNLLSRITLLQHAQVNLDNGSPQYTIVAKQIESLKMELDAFKQIAVEA